MKVFLFILSLTDASYGVLKDHTWDTIAACDAFIESKELTIVPGYAYVCGEAWYIKPGKVNENYPIG